MSKCKVHPKSNDSNCWKDCWFLENTTYDVCQLLAKHTTISRGHLPSSDYTMKHFHKEAFFIFYFYYNFFLILNADAQSHNHCLPGK